MSRSIALGGALLTGVMALFVLWFVRGERRSVERPDVTEVAGEPEEEPPELVEPAAPAAAQPVGEGRELLELESEPAARRDPIDDGPRLSGRVVVEGGRAVTGDARVTAEIHLTDRVLERRRSAEVARDGSFALRVPSGTRSVKLDLESRILFAASVEAQPGAGAVVLQARAYGALEGVLVPVFLPDSWRECRVTAALSPIDLERLVAEGDPLVLARWKETGGQVFAVPDEHSLFALGPVPVGVALVLRGANPWGPEWVQLLDPLLPGETRRVDIELEPGVTVAGRVLDENGAAVSGARVECEHLPPQAADLFGRPSWMSGVTTADSGRFELTNLAHGRWKIVVKEYELVRAAEVEVDASAGDVRDLTLSVVRGGCIEGEVVGSDGGPVATFTVWASGTAGHRSTEAHSGRFRLCGLADCDYHVEVRSQGGRTAGSASADGVRPGAAPIRLVLAEDPAFRLNGIVVDEAGAPVPRIRVYVGSESVVSHEDGTFELNGLAEGEVRLFVFQPGYFTIEQRVVVAPIANPVRLVLHASGRVHGRVVDDSGTAVANAWVADERSAWAVLSNGRVEQATDAAGRFSIPAEFAHLRLIALKKGYAPSAVLELELGSTRDVEDVVLRVCPACRVTGRVLDARGSPRVGARVTLPRFPFRKATETDDQGAFALEDLPAGALEVAACPAGDNEGKECAWAKVELAPAQPVFVELRLAEAAPVRVRGRITRNGQPVACWVSLRSHAFWNEFISGADGRFELTLQQAGEWTGAFGLVGDEPSFMDPLSCDTRRFHLTIAAGDESEIALAFESLPRVTSLDDLLR